MSYKQESYDAFRETLEGYSVEELEGLKQEYVLRLRSVTSIGAEKIKNSIQAVDDEIAYVKSLSN